MEVLTKATVRLLLKTREPNSHKGDYGHALLIAGSSGKMGAALIAAKACLRSGVGLLTVLVPKEERTALHTALPEAMLLFRDSENFDFTYFSSIGIGPGMGTDTQSEVLLTTLLNNYHHPILLDADALNCIAGNKKLITQLPKNTILTPHPKEFDRLFGTAKNSETRTATAIQKAKELNVIIVLKGHKTLITNGVSSFENTTGNAGLAKGGSGDALTGMITSFLAQGYEPFAAAQLGVFLHGLAADITLTQQSPESMLITDVIESLGATFKWIRK
jgi:NAD(P)H-hydrate epimerase